jgi:eukaryotic-like serine/threonine-protein kinase
MAHTCRAVRAWALPVSALLLAGCAAADSGSPLAVPRSALVADFVNTTGDARFDVALKHALALALSESPRLHVFEGPEVADGLRAMNESADARVSADLAWEIAVREEIDLLVLGTIEPLGPGYTVTVEAVASDDGRTIARVSAAAEGSSGVVDAVGQAALDLRRSLGDRGAAAGVPLSAALTGSIDALAHYGAGREHADKGRHAAAAPYFCRALSIDPGFEAAREALPSPDACDDVGDAPGS